MRGYPQPLHCYGQLSNRVTVASGDATPQSLVRVSGLREPGAFTLLYQLNTLPPPGAKVLLTIDELQYNGGSIRRENIRASLASRRLHVSGTGVLVTASWSGGGGLAPVTGHADVTAGLTDAPVDALGDLVPQWDTAATSGSEENRYVGSGTFLEGNFSLASLGGGGALWLFVFDNPIVANAIAAGQKPLVPPPMLTAVGQNARFNGDVRSGATFDTGLSWCLSTTADTPTLAAGAVGRFDWMGGF